MIHRIMISATISVVVLLHLTDASGNSPTKKVQIHVPHSIQHHHHTHTKYHFITLPARPNSRALNNTTSNGFQGMLPLMPVIPLIPGVTQTTTTTTSAPPAQAINPPPGIQTNALPAAGLTPGGGPQTNAFPAAGPIGGPQTNPFPAAGFTPMGGPQTNTFPVGGPTPFGGPQTRGGIGAPSGPQQQPFVPVAPVLARQSSMYVNNPGYYDYSDNIARRSQKYYQVEAPPSVPSESMKFKTTINVHESKKIPLTDLLNIANFLQKDPPRRIKVEVYPEKTAHVKQPHFEREAVINAVQSNPVGSFQQYSLSAGHDGEELHFNPDTATFQMQPRQERSHEKPEYIKVKELLEKHIQEDFPGLKVKAELIPVGTSVKERSDSQGNVGNKVPAIQASDLKHIGYVVISDNNDHRFVSLGEAQQ